MDKKEIQENDLEQFLLNFRQWWNKYGTQFLLVVLIIVLSFYLGRWWSSRHEAMLEEAYTRLEQTRSPGPLQDLARQYSHVPGYSGEALLLAAEGLMDDAMGTRALFGTDVKPLEPEEQKKKFDQAAKIYHEVIRLNHSPLQVLNARFGLAAVNESLSVVDAEKRAEAVAEARKQYEQIVAVKDWPHLALQAKSRLENLEKISQPFEMAEPPPPPPAPEASAAAPGTGPLVLPAEPAPAAPKAEDAKPEPKPESPGSEGAAPPKP